MACPSTHFRSVIDGDGTVILDLERDAIVTLNPTGGYVWDRLQRGNLVDAIVRELAAESCTDITIVDRDVRVFLKQLASNHLLLEVSA